MSAERSTDRLARFLGLNSGMTAMLGMVVLVGMGEKMAERFLPLYLIALGGSQLTAGYLNALTNLLNALYAYPGGWLSDRIGYKRALGVFNLLAMLGYGIVIAIPRWWAVLAGSVFFISWSAISLPAVMSLVSSLVPKTHRTMGVTLHSLVRRVPMALGPLAGGLLIGRFGTVTGTQVAFGAAIVLAAVALILQQVFIGDAKAERRTPPPIRHLWSRFSPSLRNLLVSDILIRFAEQIPYAYAVIWAVGVWKVTPFEFGILTAVEMATAILVYIPVARLADRGHKKPYVLATFCFFTAFPAVLFFARSFWPLVLAFVVRGLKEFGEPTRKSLIMELAPDDAKAAAFGLYYLIRDLIVSAAALAGAFLWQAGPAWNFFSAAAFGLAGTVWFALRGTDLSPARPPPL